MFHRFSHWISQKNEVTHSEEKEELQLCCLTSLREAVEHLLQTCTDRDFDANAPCTEEDSCVHAFGAAFQDCVHVGLNPNLSWWNLLSSCSLIINEPILTQSVEIADMLCPDTIGKSICWLKIVLNNHSLECTMQYILSSACVQLIHASYEDWAIMRCPQSQEAFLHFLHQASTLRFMIQVNTIPFSHWQRNSSECSYQEQEIDPSVQLESPSQPPECSEKMMLNDEEIVEITAVHYPHRHAGIKPWQYLFGVSLAYICKNPYHSRFALIDPTLSIPNIIQECIDFILHNLDTPRLFRATVVSTRIYELREFVESNSTLPDDLQLHEAAALLLDVFKNSPEPLVTTEKYDAFIAAAHLKEQAASVRNLACLIDTLPLSSKLILEKITFLLHRLQQHSQCNGLDMETAAEIFAPVIAFRNEPCAVAVMPRASSCGTSPTSGVHIPQPTLTKSNSRRSSMSHDVRFAAIGAQLVERLIQNYETIFHDVRSAISAAENRFNTKCDALNAIHTKFHCKLDHAHAPLCHQISRSIVLHAHRLKKPTEELDQIDAIICENPDSIIEAWKLHGFDRSSVAENFEHGGVLLLECIHYLIEHDEDALLRWYDQAQGSTNVSTYNPGLLVSWACSVLVRLLKLIPSDKSIDVFALAMEPFWHLFDDTFAFEKLFTLCCNVFHMRWIQACGTQQRMCLSFTRVTDSLAEEMKRVLEKEVRSVENLKSEWAQLHARDREWRDATLADAESLFMHQHTQTPLSQSLESYGQKLMDHSGILTLDHVARLDQHLPITTQLCNWYLVYSTDRDGSSLDTLLIMSESKYPTLLVVKDANDNVFGGFASDVWRRSSHYYGNGESFLFSFQAGLSLTVYPWSRRNNYFMFCSEEALMMGGGGNFGLFLVRME